MKVGAPVIGLNDSGGARIQEGVESLAGYADIFLRNTLACGVVPQISAIIGPVRRRRGLLAGDHRLHPDGEGVELHVHHRPRRHQDGHPRGGDEGGARRRDDAQREERRGALRRRRRPRGHRAGPRAALVPAVEQPRGPAASAPATIRSTARTSPLDTLVPAEPNKPYDMKDVIRSVVDDGDFFEVQEHYAKNIVVGFARLGGAAGRHRRQPAGAARRLPRHRRLGQGRALRALLRLLQHPAGHLRRRARLPARHRRRSTAASSATAPSCSTPSPRPPCPRSPSSPARPTAAPTTSWRPSTSAPTSTSPARPPRSP